MRKGGSDIAFWIPAGFTLATAGAGVAGVMGLALGDADLMRDPGIRWKVVGALVAASALFVAVATIVLNSWWDLLERRRREDTVVIELDGLAAGDTFEGVVLPGGSVRIRATTVRSAPDGNVVPLPVARRVTSGDDTSAS